MRIFSVILLLTVISAAYGGENLLSPQDFGLVLNQYNQIDMGALPPDILVDCFNGDNYEDIARFMGNRVEIYLNCGWGFYPNPSMIKYFDRNIISMRLDGYIWLGYMDIVVTLSVGYAEKRLRRRWRRY